MTKTELILKHFPNYSPSLPKYLPNGELTIKEKKDILNKCWSPKEFKKDEHIQRAIQLSKSVDWKKILNEGTEEDVEEFIQKHFPKPKRLLQPYLREREKEKEEVELIKSIDSKKVEEEEELIKSIDSKKVEEEDELIKSIDSIIFTHKEVEEEDEQIKFAINLSIMTNNVDIARRKNNYKTLGKVEINNEEEDELVKWKNECKEFMKQKNPCRKLIEKRRNLNKTFKYLINTNNEQELKIYWKKFNYINSLIKDKYGYRQN